MFNRTALNSSSIIEGVLQKTPKEIIFTLFSHSQLTQLLICFIIVKLNVSCADQKQLAEKMDLGSGTWNLSRCSAGSGSYFSLCWLSCFSVRQMKPLHTHAQSQGLWRCWETKTKLKQDRAEAKKRTETEKVELVAMVKTGCPRKAQINYNKQRKSH